MPQYRPSHVGLCVADLDRSLRFWCDGLGFERAEVYDLDSDMAPGLERSLEVDAHVSVRSQFIAHGALRIELLQFHTPPPGGVPSATRNQLGLTHLSFWVDDVDAAAAHLAACGGTVLESTRAEPGIALLFVADPDGVRVEVMAPVSAPASVG